MPRQKALIFTNDGISRCQSPDFIDLEHLNIGAIKLVEINGGTITPIGSNIGAIPGMTPPTDQIHTIGGGQDGSILVLRCQAAAAIDNTGNLRLRGNFTMDDPTDTLTLLKSGSNWIELARSNNG